MATTGFYINGSDMAANWPDKSYLIDRYPELADNMKQAGLWLWGQNTYGTLGDNTRTNESSPIQTIASGTNWKSILPCLNYNAGGIKTDGTLWIWGGSSILFTNQISVSSPVQTYAGGTNWKQASLGVSSGAGIKTDGTLWLWGSSPVGQLGNSTYTGSSTSSAVQTTPGGTNWKEISHNWQTPLAVKTDGTLWSWGDNTNGQVGVSNIINYDTPQQISGTTWKNPSSGTLFSAALKTDGTLWLWGKNNYGQLGDNTTVSKSSPVQTVAGGTNWKQVSCGYNHTSAIKTDGTLWTWGNGLLGALGDNTTVSKSSPVQTVAAGTNWKQVSSGYVISAAIKTDGTLWLWGSGGFGKLGDNTTVSKSSPVQTVAGGTNWKLVSVGSYITSAIRDDSSDPI